MKNYIIRLLLILPSRGTIVSNAPSAGQTHGSMKAAKHESPFACNIDALTPSERKRHFDEVGPMLRSLKKGVREIKKGYEFQFTADPKTFQLVSEWAIQESFCCPFFQIELLLGSERGPLLLKLTGRPGTKDFIQAEAADWIRP